MHSLTSASPVSGPDSIMPSSQAQQRRLVRAATKKRPHASTQATLTFWALEPRRVTQRLHGVPHAAASVHAESSETWLLHVPQSRPRFWGKRFDRARSCLLHLRVTSLPGTSSVARSAQAQLRRLERAAGKQERPQTPSQAPCPAVYPKCSFSPIPRLVLPRQEILTNNSQLVLLRLPSPCTPTSTPTHVCSAPSVGAHPHTRPVSPPASAVLAGTHLATTPVRTRRSRSFGPIGAACLFTQPDDDLLLTLCI